MISIEDFVKQLGSQLSEYKEGVVTDTEVELYCKYVNRKIYVVEKGDNIKSTFKVKLKGFFV